MEDEFEIVIKKNHKLVLKEKSDCIAGFVGILNADYGKTILQTSCDGITLIAAKNSLKNIIDKIDSMLIKPKEIKIKIALE